MSLQLLNHDCGRIYRSTVAVIRVNPILLDELRDFHRRGSVLADFEFRSPSWQFPQMLKNSAWFEALRTYVILQDLEQFTAQRDAAFFRLSLLLVARKRQISSPSLTMPCRDQPILHDPARWTTGHSHATMEAIAMFWALTRSRSAAAHSPASKHRAVHGVVTSRFGERRRVP